MGRSRLVPIAAGVALLVAIAIGGWWLSRSGQQQTADRESPVSEEPQEGSQGTAGGLAPQDQAPASPEENVAASTEPAEPGQTQVVERDEAEPDEDASGAAAPETAGEGVAAVPEPEVPPMPAPAATASVSGGDETLPGTEAASPVEPPENTTESLADAGDAAAPESQSASPAGEASMATAQLGKPVILPELPGAPAETLDCPGDPVAAPGCALAAEALRALGASPRPDLEVKLNREDGVYLDQEYLVVETRLPAEVGGYLYLDVLTDAGQVYHLLPEELREYNALGAGGYIRVGVEEGERRDGVRHWQVGAPFGEGYLLALLTDKPLYQGLRPPAETLVDYRDVLLGGLADAGRTSAEVVQLEFRQRE